MSRYNWLALMGGLSLMLTLSGCIVGHDRGYRGGDEDAGPYRYERGDRIDRYGHRDVHYCDQHREDEHCH